MTYKLKFLPAAAKQWKKLSHPIQSQFKKKLAERLKNTRVAWSKLSGFDSVYKIKLRLAGYRLAYEVVDDEILVYVLALGKREKIKSTKSLSKECSLGITSCCYGNFTRCRSQIGAEQNVGCI